MRLLKPLILTAVSLLSMTALGTEPRRDGNWWTSLDKNTKNILIIGFFDGMDLGGKFAYWKTMDGSKSQKKCSEIAVTSYNEHMNKYFKNTTNDQISDGLDSFYLDYRNRKIKISSAIWLVVNGISGVPDSELNKMIESWRKNSNE